MWYPINYFQKWSLTSSLIWIRNFLKLWNIGSSCKFKKICNCFFRWFSLIHQHINLRLSSWELCICLFHSSSKHKWNSNTKHRRASKEKTREWKEIHNFILSNRFQEKISTSYCVHTPLNSFLGSFENRCLSTNESCFL